MKAQRAWRNRCAYMSAGEGVMLVLWLLWFTLFHTVIDRAENLEVGRTERKLGRLNGGRARFDFVDPVEKPTHSSVIAAGGFCRELHRRCLDFRDLPSFPPDVGTDLVPRRPHPPAPSLFHSLLPPTST